VEIVGFFMMFKGNNVILYNYYVLFEFLTLHILFYIAIPKLKYVFITSLVLGLVVMLGLSIYQNGWDFLLTEGIMILAFIVSVISFLSLWHMAQKSIVPLYQVSEFWLFMGFLVYFGGIIPVMGMMRYLYADSPELTTKLYGIINVVAILRYLLTALACHKERLRVLQMNG